MGSLPDVGGLCFKDKVGSTPKGLLDKMEPVLEELPALDLEPLDLLLESSSLPSLLFLTG